MGGMSLYHNLGNGKFEDVTRQAGLDPDIVPVRKLYGRRLR